MQALSGMAIFAAVVEAGSFSTAARRLGLSTSAVSKQLARLEAHLGMRLLHRSTRRLSLTEAGELYYRHAANALEEARAAEEALAGMHDKPRGRLRVTVPMSFGLLHVVPLLPELLELHPELRVDVVLEDRMTDLIAGGFDMAIRIHMRPVKDSRLVMRRLAATRFVLCAAPTYLARRGVPETPADLARHNCLVFTEVPDGDAWRFQGPAGPVTVNVQGSMYANSGLALRDAALAGVGIARIPAFAVGPDLRAGRLRPLLAEYAPPDMTIYAVFPERRHTPAKNRLFADFLVSRWGDPPYWEVPPRAAGRQRSGVRQRA